ncbi:MAG: MFS transporter [Acidobacteria bacterium]|nr:MFS transporter [Acidobacteriota bacterium]
MISASYFFYFAMLGLLLPYLTPVLLDLSFTKSQIGLIHAAFSVISVILPSIMGRVSDRWYSADRIIKSSACVMVIMALGQLLTASEWRLGLVLCMLLFAAGRAPIVPLLDTLAMKSVGADPGAFARLRVMGSLGFAVAAIMFSSVPWESQVAPYFVGSLFCSVATAFFSFGLPVERKAMNSGVNQRFWSKLDRIWWIWLLSMVLHWMCFGPYHYGFTLLLEECGVAGYWTGPIWSIGVGSEICVFLLTRWFFARWRTRTLLMMALFASLIRWTALGLWPVLWVVAVTQVLHGFGFALFYAAAVNAISIYCGGQQQASYQSLFSTCLAGGGNVIGMGMAGYLHEYFAFNQVLLFFVPVQLAAILVLLRVKLVEARAPHLKGSLT